MPPFGATATVGGDARSLLRPVVEPLADSYGRPEPLDRRDDAKPPAGASRPGSRGPFDIDAMRALGTDPIQKLVTPRLIATAVVLPLLTIIADFVGLIGGYLIASSLLGIVPASALQVGGVFPVSVKNPDPAVAQSEANQSDGVDRHE